MDPKQLLERGFLPETLPLAFTSARFAAASDSLNHSDGGEILKMWCASGSVNVARPGGLRRRMAVVNPFKQRLLARACAAEWTGLQSHLAKSRVSISRPVPLASNMPNDRGVRYLQNELPRGDRAASRSAMLGGTRYTLQADVSNFYGSVYTHAIDWALNTKAVAKQNARTRAASLGGNLDKLVRNGQDGQTKGIPVGPDTSHLLSEILMCELDHSLQTACPQLDGRAIRYVDDFEFAARSYAEAEQVLQAWDAILADFELSLNPLKTRIIEGAMPPEALWKIQLRQHPLREESEIKLANDIRSLFSLAIAASSSAPGTPALTYAIRRVTSIPAEGAAWTELQNLLLGSITAEPSCLPRVYQLVARALRAGRIVSLNRFEEVLNELCFHHAPLEHGSEVTWALYLLHRLGLRVHSDAAGAVLAMKDNSSLILLRDLQSRQRVGGTGLDWSSVLSRAEDLDAHKGSDWLLAYEFARNGWSSDKHFRAQPHWNELLHLDVEFFVSPPELQASPQGTKGKEKASAEGAQPTENLDGEKEDTSTKVIAKANQTEEKREEESEQDEEDLDLVEMLSSLGIDRY